MKTDTELMRDVIDELHWTPEIDAKSIGVIVKDGVVTLTGHLNSFAEKHVAELAAQRVHGVKAVAVELTVRLPASDTRTDADIGLAAQRAIEWNAALPVGAIRVVVEGARITLEGQVEWEYQRAAAEAAVRHLLGVVGVTNQIAIVPKVRTLDMELIIHQALERQADREARKLGISVNGGEVTLRGTVHSWDARRAIHGAAWSAPGVTAVVDNVTIEA
jgi:osmotically-inducible protein OsmY